MPRGDQNQECALALPVYAVWNVLETASMCFPSWAPFREPTGAARQKLIPSVSVSSSTLALRLCFLSMRAPLAKVLQQTLPAARRLPKPEGFLLPQYVHAPHADTH